MELPEFLAKLQLVGGVIDDLAHNWQFNSTSADRTKRAKEGQAHIGELIAVLTPPSQPEAPDPPRVASQAELASRPGPEAAPDPLPEDPSLPVAGAGPGTEAMKDPEMTGHSTSDTPGALAPPVEIDPE